MLNNSLRLRLLILMIIPLLLVSSIAIYWRYTESKQTAEDIFDRALIALTLAVSRDVNVSGGDILSITTRDLMSEVTGGQVYYHVRGPDGTFVTGYAYPPVLPTNELGDEHLNLFDTTHQGASVRAARLIEHSTFVGISGKTVTTVWQSTSQRENFAIRLAMRAAMLTAILMTTVFLLIFFGIRFGLKPLSDLEDAIDARSSDDLSQIKRKIPIEARGIVSKLNYLFDLLTNANTARDRLISNAAHQLRNPIAAIQGMAEAAASAKTEMEMHERVEGLVGAAKHASRLSNQLLSLESIKSKNQSRSFNIEDINQTAQEVCTRVAVRAITQGIEFEFVASPASLLCPHDPLLIGEAVENLIDNALKHGGDELSFIKVRTSDGDQGIEIKVTNNGVIITKEESLRIFNRFEQGDNQDGSGLGLAIVSEIAAMHDGTVSLSSSELLTQFLITLPKRQD